MAHRFFHPSPDNVPNPEDEILIDLENFEAELASTISKFDSKHGRGAPLATNIVESTESIPNRSDSAAETHVISGLKNADPAALALSTPTTNSAMPASKQRLGEPDRLASKNLDLLSELRQVAHQKEQIAANAEAQKKARTQRTEQAMRKLFRYLGEFSSHLNKIQPVLPHGYRSPIPNIDLSTLRWRDSFVDHRTHGGTEVSPLDSISLRYTLTSGRVTRIDKLPNHAVAYQEELKRYGLPFQMVEKRGAKGLVEQVAFTIEPAVTISLYFKADSETEMIVIRTRHLTDYPDINCKEYKVAVSNVGQIMLDELGKLILGRPSQLFQYLLMV